MAYQIDIMTLFPEMIDSVMNTSIIGRAAAKGIITINTHQIRDYTENKQNQVDDYPYGGGFGCVMMAQPLKSCLDHIKSNHPNRKTRVIYMSPQGKNFSQDCARRLFNDYDNLVLVCGHYEGIDERFIESCVDEEISIGDFVLTGGEIAAMAVADCICRMVPGVLSDEECYTGESHWEKLLEYPQYTRPDVWEGMEVPEVLRKGNHADITKWRRKQMIMRTMKKRPDVFSQFIPDENDEKLIREIKRDETRLKLEKPVTFRIGCEDDIDDIMLIIRQAKNYLKKNKSDQWQSEYPCEENVHILLKKGSVTAVMYDEEIAGFYCVDSSSVHDFQDLTDGKWLCPENTMELLLFAVRAEFRGSGLSGIMMDHIKETMVSLSLKALVHRKNKPAINTLKASGFEYRGNILVFDEPYHDPRRQAFECRA